MATPRLTCSWSWRWRRRRQTLWLPPPGLSGGSGLARRRFSAVDTRSIRYGPDQPPLLTPTIPEHFASVVAAHADRPAVMCRSPSPAACETVLSYGELDRLSNRLAASLAGLGVRPGDRVAVSLGNGPEFAGLTYAIFKLGAVLVPLNPAFNAGQVRAALQHLGVQVLVVGAITDLPYRPGRGRSNEEMLAKVLGVDNLRSPSSSPSSSTSSSLPALRHVVVVDNTPDHPDVLASSSSFKPALCPGLIPYASLLAGSPAPVRPLRPLDPSDTINIQFTSGTTSLPKAAMLSHTSILNNGALVAHRMGLAPSDRIVVPPPLFHCFGSVLGYMATATTGAALLLPSPAFDPVASLRMCADHDATGLYGVSTMLVAILDALEALEAGSLPHRHPPPASLRKGIVAGSSVPEALMRRLQDRLGLRDLVICYGMTETSPVSVMTSPADPLEARTASVGSVMPHTAVKIVDPADRRSVLPLGTRGELAASGYLVMKGYYGDPERTAAVRIRESDGRVWVYSGDEAEMDADGFVRITGRIKDLIIRAGENIHPLEIENCLFQMPGIREVAVVGVHDHRLGEAVAAFVIPRSDWTTAPEDDDAGPAAPAATTASLGVSPNVLTKHAVRARVRTELSSHLVPKYVFWTDEYPKTASGKIQKFKLREEAETLIKEQEKKGEGTHGGRNGIEADPQKQGNGRSGVRGRV